MVGERCRGGGRSARGAVRVNFPGRRSRVRERAPEDKNGVRSGRAGQKGGERAVSSVNAPQTCETGVRPRYAAAPRRPPRCPRRGTLPQTPRNVNVIGLIEQGGTTTILLLLLSVLSIAVALRKLIAFGGASERVGERLTERVLEYLDAGDTRGALHATRDAHVSVMGFRSPVPLANVFRYQLESTREPTPEALQSALARLDRETMRLEKGLGVLATLGSVAPFIGLFGTVVGVIRAFDALSVTQDAGLGPVMAGIAEALVATAAGLLVAVPAVIFYNYFVKRLKRSAAVGEQGVLEVHAALAAQRVPAPRYAPLPI